MSDANDTSVFARFVYEMRTLLTAIEAHCAALSVSAPSERRPQALREMTRLAGAASALAEAFAVDDLRSLAGALAAAATSAMASATFTVEEQADANPLPPLGARDALSYMQWRIERLSAAGQTAPPTPRDLQLVATLEQALHGPSAPGGSAAETSAADATSSAATFADASELTLAERALVESFATATLRKRDLQADERLLARMAEAPTPISPSFMAQSQSGDAIPVFGGVMAEDLDEIPPEMKRNFVNETTGDLRELGQYVLAFERDPQDTHALAQLAYIAHKIKGSAATMGFPGMSEIAVLFEEVVAHAQSGKIGARSGFLSGLGRFLPLLEQGLAAANLLDEPAPTLLDDARRLRTALLNPHPDRANTSPPASAQVLEPDQSVEGARAADHELVLRVEARKLDMLMNELSALAVNRGAIARNRSEIARTQAEMQATLTRLREKSAQISDSYPLAVDTYSAVVQSAGPSHRLPSSGTLTAPLGVAPSGMAGLAEAGVAGVAGGSTVGEAPMASPSTSGALRASWSSLRLEQYTEVDTALRALAEVVADVASGYSALTTLLNRLGQLTETQEALARDIQADAMSIRLAHLAEIAPRLSISARVAARDLGKQIQFDVQGETIVIDRLLLEALEQPLIQLVRNAVAHGVETPEEREEQGKPAAGRVKVQAYNIGSEVVIDVSDDGRGVNANLLVGAAIAAHLITPEEARRLTQEQALSVMFQLGVSTLPATTIGYVGAMAGSGVGLADVANTIHRLKGSITVRSDLGKGTTFQIRAPISLSMAPVLEVGAAGQAFALPFALVEYTAIIAPEQLRQAPPAPSTAAGGPREWRLTLEAPSGADTVAATGATSEMRAFALAELLGFEQEATALQRVVVFRLRGQSVGLLVESLGDGDMREATVRPLPQRLQRRVVRGAIVRPEDGQVALLIDPQEALAQCLAGAEITLRPASLPARPRAAAPVVLIVDDSVTIRRTLEQMLTQAGFRTSQARDGMEALEVMERELPRVVILDVEMPRLSGFELLTVMRSSSQYEHARVVMLTSRAADKHRDYALAIGADAYLVKPCPQETLVETIRRLLTESEPG